MSSLTSRDIRAALQPFASLIPAMLRIPEILDEVEAAEAKIEKEVKSRQQAIDALEVNRQECEKKAAMARSQLHSETEKLHAVYDQVAAAQREREGVESQTAAIVKKHEQMNLAIVDMQKECEKLKASFENQKQRQEKELEKVRQEIVDARKVLDSMMKDITRIRQQYAS